MGKTNTYPSRAKAFDDDPECSEFPSYEKMQEIMAWAKTHDYKAGTIIFIGTKGDMEHIVSDIDTSKFKAGKELYLNKDGSLTTNTGIKD